MMSADDELLNSSRLKRIVPSAIYFEKRTAFVEIERLAGVVQSLVILGKPWR